MRTTILESIVGSTVHGVAVKDGLEDLDLMAVAIEDAPQFVGFATRDCWVSRSKPEGVRSEAGDVDRVEYGLRKFCGLASKGNPSVLLLLFAPDSAIRVCSDVGHELLALAPCFVSKQVFMPFRGYIRQQHERLLGLRGQRNVTRPELVDAFGYDTKYAAHIVRLGFQGEEILLTGKITLPMPVAAREFVVKVRKGGFSLAEISEHLINAEKKLERALAASDLADSPDQNKIESWMIQTYLNHWNNKEKEPKV